MQPTNITLICVSSNSKVATYSTPTEPVRQSEIKRDENNRFYYCHGKEKILLPNNLQSIPHFKN